MYDRARRALQAFLVMPCVRMSHAFAFNSDYSVALSADDWLAGWLASPNGVW